MDLDAQDAGVVAHGIGWCASEARHVDHGQHLAMQVEQAGHDMGRPRQRLQARHRQHAHHAGQGQREPFAFDVEHHQFHRVEKPVID